MAGFNYQEARRRVQYYAASVAFLILIPAGPVSAGYLIKHQGGQAEVSSYWIQDAQVYFADKAVPLPQIETITSLGLTAAERELRRQAWEAFVADLAAIEAELALVDREQARIREAVAGLPDEMQLVANRAARRRSRQGLERYEAHVDQVRFMLKNLKIPAKGLVLLHDILVLELSAHELALGELRHFIWKRDPSLLAFADQHLKQAAEFRGGYHYQLGQFKKQFP